MKNVKQSTSVQNSQKCETDPKILKLIKFSQTVFEVYWVLCLLLVFENGVHMLYTNVFLWWSGVDLSGKWVLKTPHYKQDILLWDNAKPHITGVTKQKLY